MEPSRSAKLQPVLRHLSDSVHEIRWPL